MLEYGNIMKGSLIANIQIIEEVVMIKNHNDVHEIIFFLVLNHVLWALMFKNLQILIMVLSIKRMQLGDSWIFVAYTLS